MKFAYLFGEKTQSAPRGKCLQVYALYSGQKIASEASLPPKQLEPFLNALLPEQASLCKNCGIVLKGQQKDFCSENVAKLT